MRKLTFILCYLVCFLSSAQVRISGTVIDETKAPLLGASVYINNTSIGTTTDDQGNFELYLKEGTYELVVSYVGFVTEKKNINTSEYKGAITFILEAKYNELDEVVIKRKKKRSAKRKAYLRRFRQKFLGESKLSKNCKILNEDAIDFEFDPAENTLEAYVSEPLKIVNNSLGYEISYDLVHFDLTPSEVHYLGNVKYSELKGSNKQQKKWRENRFKAYQGSKMHFLRSITKGTVKEEGFVVDLSERNPNPKRPSYKEIVDAEKVLNKTSGLQRDPFGRSEVPNSELSKAKEILKRSQLPEYVDKVVQKDLPQKDYTLLYEGEFNLRFSDYLRVTYTKESPDRNYESKQSSSKYQVSMVLLFNKVAAIRKSGVLKKPLDVFFQGYWAFERVADALPLDYEPQ